MGTGQDSSGFNPGFDGPALLFEDSRWSWRELVAAAAVRAALLGEWEDATADRRGERPLHVGILLDNVPEYLFVLSGAALAGVVVVGVNPTRRGAELAADIRGVDCDVLVTDADGLGLLAGLDTGVPAEFVVDVRSDAWAVALDAHDGASPQLALAAHDPGATVLLLFTSGSTGAPKAVLCGTGRLAMIAQINHRGMVPDDVAYSAMPLFHGNAIMAMFAPCVAVGATFAMRRRFSASGFVPDIRRFGATVVNYVGRSLAYVLAVAEIGEEADNRLRVVYGTEASPRDRREFARRFGITPVESYGSSEGGAVILPTPDTPEDALGVGGPHMDVVVLEESGVECPCARFDETGRLVNADVAIGEIVNRTGAAMFEGYYRAPEATAERVDGYAYRTGDLAYRDADGFFYFAGRLGDRLRVDSENFSAGPVERVLGRLPGVLVVAVYPVPDPRTGDQVMAAVQMEPDRTFDPEAFGDFLHSQHDLGTKWWPRFVRVVGTLPTTATRKLAKSRLRRESWVVEDPVYLRDARGYDYRELGFADRGDLLAEYAAQGRDVHGI